DVLEVLHLVEGVAVDLVLTDPPYCSGGNALEAKQADTAAKYQQTGTKKRYPAFGGDHLDQRAFVFWCAEWGRRSRKLLKTGGIHVQFTDWRQLPATVDAVQMGGFHWRGI